MPKHPDYVLLFLVAILVLWGLFTVGTISFSFSLERYGTPWYYLSHQLLMLGIGIVCGVLAFKLSLKTLKKRAPLFFGLNLMLLTFVFLPKIGLKLGGARRWLSFGSFGFQPSEFLKISFLLYLAAWLAARTEGDKKKKFRELLLPFAIILTILLVVLILQPDMTTLIIISLAGIAMYFIAATPWWHLPLLAGAGLGAGILLIKFASYRANRLLVFLRPKTEPLGIGYQLQQASIAIGSGKIFGIENGLGLGFLPQPMTDSIFAIIGEKIGFIGAASLVLLFLLFAWCCLKISVNSEKNFERFLAAGISVWLGSQALLNMGGITGIIPMGGIPLPFFSYGGSHLIAEMIGVGLLLNISKTT